MYKYILLDADNTLLDFDSAQYSSFKTVLQSYGIEYTDEIYSKYLDINHSLWSAFERGEINSDNVQTERFSTLFQIIGQSVCGGDANNKYQEALKEQCQLMPYAEEVCKELSLIATLVIVTNGVGATQKSRIAKSDIAKYISFSVISEDVGFQKPNVAFFNEVLTRLNHPMLNEILIVGDSFSSDIQGGINMGIHTCYYNPRRRSDQTDIKPDYMISDLRELIVIAKADNY